MDHRLLVASLVVSQRFGILGERLAETGNVAVPEDAPAAGEEPLLDAIALDVLLGQEPHERLGHRQPLHARTPVRTMAAAASTAAWTSPSGG